MKTGLGPIAIVRMSVHPAANERRTNARVIAGIDREKAVSHEMPPVEPVPCARASGWTRGRRLAREVLFDKPFVTFYGLDAIP